MKYQSNPTLSVTYAPFIPRLGRPFVRQRFVKAGFRCNRAGVFAALSQTRGVISLLRVPAALFALACGLANFATAQVVVLDNFNATGATGKVITTPASTWIGNVTRNQTSITVGGNARDDNGWGASNVTVNATGMKFITIAGQRDSGNLAPSLVIQLIDSGLQTQIFSVPTTSFSAAGLSLVESPIGTWTSGFNPAQITDWTIGGGTTGIAAFRMTLENLSLSATALPARHSADTDQNFRINLTELTRVMELYQTRNSGVRTGCYDVATSTARSGHALEISLRRYGPRWRHQSGRADANDRTVQLSRRHLAHGSVSRADDGLGGWIRDRPVSGVAPNWR